MKADMSEFWNNNCNRIEMQNTAGDGEELTDAQISQQDCIDGMLDAMVRTFKPDFEHNLERTGHIRGVLVTLLSEQFKVSEMDIYPYFEI